VERTADDISIRRKRDSTAFTGEFVVERFVSRDDVRNNLRSVFLLHHLKFGTIRNMRKQIIQMSDVGKSHFGLSCEGSTKIILYHVFTKKYTVKCIPKYMILLGILTTMN
jgi:hypothetical protein